MPKEEIEFVEEWLNSGEDYRFLVDRMRENFKECSPDEISRYLDEYITDESCYMDLIESIPDIKYIIDKLETLGNHEQNAMLRYIPADQLYKYANDKGQASDTVLKLLAEHISRGEESDFLKLQMNAMESLDSDLDRAKIILFGGEEIFLPYIEDLYYRNQIAKAKSEYNFGTDGLLAEIEIYNEHLKKISEIKDESSKAEYISTIKDNDMKQALLEMLEEKENRRLVIESFERKVDPEIESLDELARNMITEFFEDRLGGKFTDEMRERVQNVFTRTDVFFENLEPNINGKAYHIQKAIAISDKHKNSINRNIGFLIHEYAHLFSGFDYSYTMDLPEHSVEEGMADTFADLVVNYYINKHNDVILDEKKIRIDKPYITYSGYDFENAWPRTMLAGLESRGEDIEAIAEYMLGEKKKFAEMIFGKEVALSKEHTKFGIPKIKTNRTELYHSSTLDFSNIDENSIYYGRNNILPLFQIQNRLGEKEDIVGIISQGRAYFASYIAELYFDGKKFYEVPNEEFEEFIRLIDGQIGPDDSKSAIVDILQYKNEIINSLTDEEIHDFSFEILEKVTTLFGKNIEVDYRLERVMQLAFDEEIRKINEGQSLDITREKKKIISQKYKDAFAQNSENNRYINDYINDFYFEVSEAEKLQQRQQNKEKQITPQQIGKATINAPTASKREAEQVEKDGKKKESVKEGEEIGDGN